MDISLDPQRVQTIRNAIETFLQERLRGKLDKLTEDDPKRTELIAQFQRSTWIEDAANRAKQIQIATHLVKPINPNARGTNLYLSPDILPPHVEVGSHQLPLTYKPDVTGNAGAFDVYAFLSIEIDHVSLLEWLLRNDYATVAALHEDMNEATSLARKFTAIASKKEISSTHTLSKQLYWFVGEDASENSDYHLLAPLHSSPLTQCESTSIS